MKKIHSFLIVILLFFVMAFAFSFGDAWKTLSDPRDEAAVTLGNSELTVLVSDTPQEREQGLSGRNSLEPYDGMLFLFPEPGRYSFWMKNMRFPIDIVWIRDSRIIGVTESIPPPEAGTPDSELEIYRSPDAIDSALEVFAGNARRLELSKGQSIEF